MKLLLDTHTLLWWAQDTDRLSATARRALINPRNQVAVSVVSVWELVIKESLGRIAIEGGAQALAASIIASQFAEILDVTLSDVMEWGTLPPVHRDPFDRLLIAQAVGRRLTLVSCDRAFTEYPVGLLW